MQHGSSYDRRVESQLYLKTVQLVVTEDPVLILVAQCEYPLEGAGTPGGEALRPGIVQGRQRVHDRLLCIVEHFPHLGPSFCGALQGGLDLGKLVHELRGDLEGSGGRMS